MKVARKFREPIDPSGYSHQCNNEGTYVPKRGATRTQTWQKVSDTTGRGYGQASHQVPGSVSNQISHGVPHESLPRPSLATITTQNPRSLDFENRFYVDTKKRLNTMIAYSEHPQIESIEADNKASSTLSTKVTFESSSKVVDAKTAENKGIRQGVIRKSYITAPGKQMHVMTKKQKTTKQVSEVDEQGAGKQNKTATVIDTQAQYVIAEPNDNKRLASTYQQCSVEVDKAKQQPAALVTTETAEDQQQARIAAPKQEEQDETTTRQTRELVVAMDPQCPSRHIYMPPGTGANDPVVLCCKKAAKRHEFQKRDPCLQRSSALLKDYAASLLDAPKDERHRSSYTNQFYKKEVEVTYGGQTRPAGIATNLSHFNVATSKPVCSNKCNW